MRWWRWIGVMVLLGIGFSPAGAQDSKPIIFLRAGEQAERGYGDLWSWTPGEGEPFRETTWGYNSAIALSPDGSKVAYASLPAWAADGVAAGTYRFDSDRQDPANIWVMDIASRQFTRIADQGTPPDVYSGVYRTAPVWSPDSQKIAWLELDPDPNRFAGQVVVYDLASGEKNVWARGLGMNYADGGIFWLAGLTGWGSHISREFWTYGLPGGYDDPGTLLEFVGENGFVRDEALVIDGLSGATYPRGAMDNRWVLHQGKWYMALEYDYGWQLIDAASGERMTLNNPPLLQTADGVGLRLRRVHNDWEVLLPDGRSTLLGYAGYTVTLSPDGQTLVYVEDGQPYIWRDGQSERYIALLPASARNWNIISVVWTPTMWVTDGVASPLPYPTLIPTQAAPVNQG